DTALAVEQEFGGDRIGLDVQIAARPRLGQKCPRRRTAPAAAPRHLRIGDALLGLAVVVGGIGEPGLLRRFDKFVGERQDRTVILDDQRTALAAIFGIAIAAIGFRFAEEG